MKALATGEQAGGYGKEPVPLESFPVLAKVGERDLAALRSVTASKEYGRGECILPTADETSNIVAIRKGSVNICLASPDGREMALRCRNAGDLVGLLADEGPGIIPIVAQAKVDETLVSLIPATHSGR